MIYAEALGRCMDLGTTATTVNCETVETLSQEALSRWSSIVFNSSLEVLPPPKKAFQMAYTHT